VDAKAITLTMGALMLRVTSDTTIPGTASPATLADGVVGEQVSGAYKKTSDGKLNANSIHFVAKAENTKKDASKTGGDN